ncbi:sulfurtransferase [Noviherbaspirillum denitrificans]|uniref:Sulfurtransferase n=1 Tax=Noviherbaspirillum denitrificans TaxID=1968433 RepID=A0A254TJ00_9BURK|nr:sulfurtransferase [Noviherbaspirillum denitrificans]OWW20543.1 3-mercaptopyruvate sulfurtransferase [Noviherbaspirillum denitrificans]
MTYTTLIAAEDLSRHVHDADWVVLDCRHDLTAPDAGRDAYESGHIPGAQFARVDEDLSDKSPGPHGEFRGRHPLPERTAFVETLRRWGVNHGTQVVAYDAQGGMFAARLWWMLRWTGHEAVAVLDGGIQSWQALGLPLATTPVSRPRGNAMPNYPLVSTVSADDVMANLTNPVYTVIDARAPDRFRGENETLDPVGGHIPGAKSRFFKDNLQADGRFKPEDQLRADFSALSIAPEKTIMQCGSGVTACHNLLAMEIAGLRGAALYPGSWSEWCSDKSRPVATGN